MSSNSDDAFDKTQDAGTANAPVALAAGGHLGKYRLDRVLGEGGMGVVWAAHDPDLERAVAIKVLRYAQAAPQLRQRLLREARAMAKLKHPNVLTVYEVGTVGDRDYIAMELVEGTSLERWLAASPPQEEIWSAVLAAGRGLAAAHEAGVVHRDFKPHNVLRSREGRVLVTDFGLARGLLGEEESASIAAHLDAKITPFEVAAESVVTPRPSDPVLDSPLTQTGALIGTPAYMAPEQYAGAPPDPRTDQFAFCVTAWQALTGDRPFHGQTLDEMRTSASAGVDHIECNLHGAVRAVLARGLHAKADERWPALDELLDALEKAGRLPARRRHIAVAAFGLAAAAALVTTQIARDHRAKTKDGCDDSERVFAEAWSPALRSELARSTHAQPAAFARVADAFDQYRDRWVASYDKACKARASKSFRPRMGCLEGIRDQVSALSYLLRDADPRLIDAFDPWGVLPNLAVCESASPIAPPSTPTDQRRAPILKMYAHSFALRAVPDQQLDATVDKLVDDATALNWQPLVSGALVVAGNEYLRRGNVTRAREHFKRALATFRADAPHDLRVEASARLGLLEASARELEKPGTHAPPGLTDRNAKPTLHDELARLITSANAATAADAMLAGARALIVAEIYAELGQFNRYRHAYDDALANAAEARKQFESIGDTRRAAHASVIEAWIYLARGDARALDDALFAARRGADALDADHLAALADLDEIRELIAFARRDYTEAHRILDRRTQRRVVDAPAIKGRVTPAGTNAIVVAWRGDLVGDPRRIYKDPASFVGDIATVASDGSFTIHAEPGWAIMAEGAAGRSTPQPAGAAPSLQLRPVVTQSGTVAGPNLFGVKAYARFAVGTAHWNMEVPVDSDASFDLRSLPPGNPIFGLAGPAGNGARTTVYGPLTFAKGLKDVTWPHGQAVEIIVRSKQFDAGARAYLFRGRVVAETRADLDARVETSRDAAISGLASIGSSNTDAGRELYQPGDRHAVITGNEEDDYTACAVATTTGGIACKTLSVKRTVDVPYPDGRYAAGVTPIILEL